MFFIVYVFQVKLFLNLNVGSYLFAKLELNFSKYLHGSILNCYKSVKLTAYSLPIMSWVPT